MSDEKKVFFLEDTALVKILNTLLFSAFNINSDRKDKICENGQNYAKMGTISNWIFLG